MSHVTHTLFSDENRLYAHALTRDCEFVAVPVVVEDCGQCFFRNRDCPVTSTGCAACSADVRDDGKNIIWMNP